MVRFGRLETEKMNWIEVLVLSQPNNAFVIKIHTTDQSKKAPPQISSADKILQTAILLRPCFVQRRMSSAPV